MNPKALIGFLALRLLGASAVSIIVVTLIKPMGLTVEKGRQ